MLCPLERASDEVRLELKQDKTPPQKNPNLRNVHLQIRCKNSVA